MIRLWQSLSQRIGSAVRLFETDEVYVEQQVDAIMSDMERCSYEGKFNAEAFRQKVAWHLKTERRFGRWEGADLVKGLLKPFVKAVEAIDNGAQIYTIHTTDGPVRMVDGDVVRDAVNAAIGAGK